MQIKASRLYLYKTLALIKNKRATSVVEKCTRKYVSLKSIESNIVGGCSNAYSMRLSAALELRKWLFIDSYCRLKLEFPLNRPTTSVPYIYCTHAYALEQHSERNNFVVNEERAPETAN